MSQLIQDQDFLFSLAGQTSHLDSMTDPFTDLNINVTAQLSILEAARKHNPRIRIVFASTRQIYGKPRYLPVDEAHPIVPVDINGSSQAGGGGLPPPLSSRLRAAGVLPAPDQHIRPGHARKDARQTFLGLWLKLVLTGQPIDVFGDGLQLRDFNYVDDVVEAMLRAATRDAAVGQVANLGSDETINPKDLAEMLVAVNGSEAGASCRSRRSARPSISATTTATGRSRAASSTGSRRSD